MPFRSSVSHSLHTKLNFKLLLLGRSGVGKTSLLLRFVKDIFNKQFSSTIGVEFYSKVVMAGSEEVAMQMWDSGGQEQYQTMAKSFLNHTHCVLIVYSSPQEARALIQPKIEQMNEYAPQGVRLAVARTKIDQNIVEQEEEEYLNSLVTEGKIDLWGQVSAKTGDHVNEFFDRLAVVMHEKYHSDDSFRELVEPKKDSFVLSKLEIDQNKTSSRRCCS